METLMIERRDGVAIVTLNRPDKRNAVNRTMWRELTETFEEIDANRDDRVMVLTGAGSGFCSGADLSDPESASSLTGGVGSSLAQMRVVGRCALTLHHMHTPTIAAVNGVAAGAGCNMALGCDLIIASTDARFAEIFAKRGLNVDFGGSWLLPRLIGLHRAKELLFMSEIVEADEAERIGLVNRVVPADDLMDTVGEIARHIASLPPNQLSISKRLLNQSFSVSMADALEFEDVAQVLNFQSADTAEAMVAFREKRDPNFTGE